MNAENKKCFWIVLSACFAAFMATLDSYIVNISLPTIAQTFDASASRASLVSLSYLFFNAGSMLIFGKLVDRVGLKKIFLWGYVVFTASSLLCGLSSHLAMLVVSRAIQGVGGAMITIPPYAIIPKYLPENKRGGAYGLLSTAAALGLTLGAPLGGVLTGYVSWHYIFLINIPVGVLAFILSMKIIPEDIVDPLKKKTGERFDYRGAVLSFLCVFLLLHALNNGKEMGWKSLGIILSFLFSGLFFILFILCERRCSHPQVDLKVFRIRSFLFANLTSIAAYLVLAGNNFILPFFLELVKNLRPQQGGLVLMVYTVTFMLVSPLVGRLADKTAPFKLCAGAMFFAALSCAFFVFTLHTHGIIPVISFLLMLAVSYGFFFSPNNCMVMSSVPENLQGTASGIFSALSRLSAVLGVCIFESIFSQFAPQKGSPASVAGLTSEELTHSFMLVYIFAALVCLLGFSFSLLAGKRVSSVPHKDVMAC